MYSDFIINASQLPDYSDWNVKLSNAFVGHRLHGNTVYMNGFYNGAKEKCHRARIPCPIQYIRDDVQSYSLNLKTGIYSIIGEGFKQEIYAHNVLNRVFISEIEVVAGEVVMEDHHGPPSSDLVVLQDDTEGGINHFHAKIKEAEMPGSDVLEVVVVSSVLDSKLEAGKYLSISAFGYTTDEATKFYNLASDYYVAQKLRDTHIRVWSYIWNTVSITVDNPELSLNVNSSLFYLLSAFPAFCLPLEDVDLYPFVFYGVSPGGLGNGGDGEDYWGHVFWDQDLWMLPNVMFLFPEMVKQSILYRIRVLPGARTKAENYGYRGAMYPWESARTGVDVCPGEIYAKYQQHVTADVVYAIRQYVYATGDWGILSDGGGWDLVRDTADFWVSRVQWNGENFVIDKVMDPDEYHYNVNNSCYTNASAKLNLKFAIEAAERLEHPVDDRWRMISNDNHGLKIPFDTVNQYHPEYDGYTVGTKIKQASVVLLGYPLMFDMDSTVRKNDIIIYEKCTAQGPAMTYSMYTIGMLELGDVATAASLFKVQFKNITKPFKIWNEYAQAYGCTNFLTGIGGFLQSLYFGYLGLRVYESYFQLNPYVTPECGQITFKGVQYQAERFDISAHTAEICVKRTTGNAFELWVIESVSDGTIYPLVTGQLMTLKTGCYKVYISKS